MSLLFDLDDIRNSIPHRDPFLFVDGVLELDHGKSIAAVKKFGPEQDFFKGHFPGNPVVPGVIIVEALAQASGVLVFTSFTEEMKEKGVNGAYLASLDKVRFRKVVVPDDEIRLESRIERKRANIIIFKAEASVEGEKAAEAEIMVSLY